MNGGGSVNRSYRSPLRQANAKATRLRIIEAATRLFIERGFGATSIDDVAEAAGVGRATVFTSVGGKIKLLRTAYDVALVGDDEPIALPQRSWVQPVLDARSQGTRIDRYAEVIASYDERVAPIYEVLRGAAGSDPEAREQWEEVRAGRRVGAANFVKVITELGPLKPGLGDVSAADVVWVLNDPGLYHQLAIQRGWSSDAFCRWVADTMRAQLLTPAAARRRRSR